jgi:hypothetical protein
MKKEIGVILSGTLVLFLWNAISWMVLTYLPIYAPTSVRQNGYTEPTGSGIIKWGRHNLVLGN